jgi:hypothetical protein
MDGENILPSYHGRVSPPSKSSSHNSNSGGEGVELSPFGTTATNWPVVPAPGDYEDGEFDGIMIWQGKPKY